MLVMLVSTDWQWPHGWYAGGGGDLDSEDDVDDVPWLLRWRDPDDSDDALPSYSPTYISHHVDDDDQPPDEYFGPGVWADLKAKIAAKRAAMHSWVDEFEDRIRNSNRSEHCP